jgi:hypothetical protein
VGVYNYKVVATDSLTGLVNNANVFTITIDPPILATDLILNAATQISSQNYLVGSPALVLSVPTYTIVPVNADRSLTYSVTGTTPSFV